MAPRSSDGSAENHDPWTTRTRAAARPSPAKLAVATASAPADTSVAHTDRVVRSAARDIAITPDPVPRSTAVRGGELVDRVQRMLDDHLRLGSRDENPPVDVHVERAETPPAEHVLQRLARRATVDHLAVPGLGAFGGVPVEMQHQLCALATAGLLDDATRFGAVTEPIGRLVEQPPPARAVRQPNRRAGGSARRARARPRSRRARRPAPCRASGPSDRSDDR